MLRFLGAQRQALALASASASARRALAPVHLHHGESPTVKKKVNVETSVVMTDLRVVIAEIGLAIGEIGWLRVAAAIGSAIAALEGGRGRGLFLGQVGALELGHETDRRTDAIGGAQSRAAVTGHLMSASAVTFRKTVMAPLPPNYAACNKALAASSSFRFGKR